MNCAFCGQKDNYVLLDIKNDESHYLTPGKNNGNRKWHKCKKCGIGFSSPRLTKDEIEWMYENYRNTSFRNETPDEYYEKITTLPQKESENYQKYLYIRKTKKEMDPSNILDIGCGGGVLINELQKHWKDANYYGIEPSPNFAELASRKTGAVVKNTYFTKETAFDIKFDLIICCQVLEHVEEINIFIDAMKNNLSDNGIIYLEVPDQSDFDLLEESHSRFTEPSHLWYFSEESLNKIIKSNGLHIVKSDIRTTIRGRRNLMYLVK